MRLQAITAQAAPRIAEVRFGRLPSGVARVIATFEDGHIGKAIDYDPNLLEFTAPELIGLTRHQARELRDRKLDQLVGFEQF